MNKTKILATVSAVFLTVSMHSEAAQVAVFGEGFDLNIINNFYNTLPGHSSTIVTTLSTSSLADVGLLWAVQPADAYSAGELSLMSTFLAGGGRIAFMGEHGQFRPNENIRINAAISALGGNISIINTIDDSGFRDATVADGQILSHNLTAGVNTYNYAAFARLSISGTAEALMVGENDPNAIMMAYQNIGAGSIFLITDQNVWDNVYQTTNDNSVMFTNLLTGNTGAPPANQVPDGGSTLALSGLAALSLLGLKRLSRKD